MRELGWDDQRQAEWDADPVSTSGARPGRVVRVERTVVRVALDLRTVTVHATGLAVGDWVATDGESWASPLARRTQLSRQSSDRTSSEQVLAANVDVVIIVESVSPEPNPRRVERLLTLAWASGATPLVVLTKKDLALVDHVPEIEAVALGVDVVAVSSHTGEGVEEVRRVIGATPGRTFVLVGPSGAGKSSLVNALAGHQVMATAEVRSDGKGRHTTTHRELLHIDGLGCLVDTPGIRSVGMTSHESGLDATFEDVLGYASQCRFDDCTHSTEPGCQVMQAVEDGSLDLERVDSYRRIEREIAHQTLRKTAHDRRDERLDTKGRRTAKRVVMEAKGRADGR